MSGLEMLYFSGSWIAWICLWCWGCDEGLLSSFQSNSIPTTFLSPEEKHPSPGGDTAQSHREGAAEAVFAACAGYSSKGAGAQGPVFQISGAQEVLGKDVLWAWKWKSSLIWSVRLINWWDSGYSVHTHGVICAHWRTPCEIWVCSAAVPGGPYWSPFGAQGASAHRGRSFPAVFPLGLHLLHFNEQPLSTFSQELSVLSCSQMRKGKKALLKWRGRTRRIQQDRSVPEGFKWSKELQPLGKALSPPQQLPLLPVHSQMQNVPNALGKTHLWMHPRVHHPTRLVQLGCKVFCAILHSGLFCNNVSDTSPGSKCFSLGN